MYNKKANIFKDVRNNRILTTEIAVLSLMQKKYCGRKFM